MGYAITSPPEKPRRRTTSSSQKTASGDFFALTKKPSLENLCNPLKPRQGNAPAPTKTASGVLYEHYRYTAFGEPEIYTPTGAKLAASAIDNTVLWNSRRYDVDTNLYYYALRHYKADIGRWLSRDPIEEDGGINLYVYVGNEPIGRWDKYGLLYDGWEDGEPESWDDMLEGMGGGGGGIRDHVSSIEYDLETLIENLSGSVSELLEQYGDSVDPYTRMPRDQWIAQAKKTCAELKSPGPFPVGTFDKDIYSREFSDGVNTFWNLGWDTIFGVLVISKTKIATSTVTLTGKVNLKANVGAGCKCVDDGEWVPDYLVIMPTMRGSIEGSWKIKTIIPGVKTSGTIGEIEVFNKVFDPKFIDL